MADETEHQYDLFVAYADDNGDWVQNYLLPKLGLPSGRIITKLDFTPGAIRTSEFARSIRASRHTVLVLSPEYFEDEWAIYGGQLVGYLSVSQPSNQLIPLLLKACELPLEIEFRVKIDCTDKTKWDAEINRLRNLLSCPVLRTSEYDVGVSLCTLQEPLNLEVPEGVVPPGSPFYVRRRADDQLEHQLEGSGTTTTIRGARQTGKTSLLGRGVFYAQKRGATVVYIDFQAHFDQPAQLGYDQFFRYLAHAIARRAQATIADVDAIWETDSSTKDKLTQFIGDLLLTPASGPVVLAIDEADIMLETPFYEQFFSLLRSWHNKRAFDPLWTKLNIVMAISTHPALLIKDIHHSPFNVALRIQLSDFDKHQVQTLNEKHGSPLRPSEVRSVMDLLGGHPYLIRQALYTLACEGMAWTELEAVADQTDGPFGAHLLYYLELLRKDPECVRAAQQILQSETCPSADVQRKLMSVGLITVEKHRCVFRYALYRKFFVSQL